jgi:membrane fusion protein, heavy metal efflux system
MGEMPSSKPVLQAFPSPGPEGVRSSPWRAVRSRLCRALPPFFIFALLGGLVVWGHLTDWTLPQFASLTGTASERKDDWCSEHTVPESQCVECNPGLMPRPKAPGWCRVHGIHECPLEHPEIAQTQYRPQVSASDMERARRALAFAERPENNSKCKLHQRRIQFTSQEAVEKAGIEVEPVWTAPVVETVTGNGEVVYDQTQMARLSSRVPGSVFRVFKQAGDAVKKGEVLALVDAAEVGKARSEFLTALVQVRLRAETLQRYEALYARGALPEVSYRNQAAATSEAKIRLTTAQEAMTNLGLPVDVESLKDVPQDKLADRLRFLGLPESVAQSLDSKKTTGNLLAVTSPLDGVVVARDVVAGEVVDNSKVLLLVVDTRRMWLTLSMRLEDAKPLALGQKVQFRPDGSKDEVVGSVAWVSPEADRKTRTVRVRVVLPNVEGCLRTNTFGVGKIILREEPQAIVVPNGAVHWEGDCNVVFVRDKDFLKPGAPKVFHTRTVRLGARDERHTEIIAGVLPGELVATRGSGTLRAELLRGKLGEG